MEIFIRRIDNGYIVTTAHPTQTEEERHKDEFYIEKESLVLSYVDKVMQFKDKEVI